jgi:hypothetical protein
LPHGGDWKSSSLGPTVVLLAFHRWLMVLGIAVFTVVGAL